MIGEEQLIAYADGELPPEEAAKVEAAVAADPSLKARLERHKRLRARLAGAFQDVMEESTPQRLRAAVEGMLHPSAELVDLEAVRHAQQTLKRAKRRPKPPAWAPWAMAAGLAALALLFAVPFLKPPRPPGQPQLVSIGQGVMTARGPLANALDSELASEPRQGERIAIGLTFKDGSGHWCRSFTAARDGVAGLACRDGGAWRLHVLAQAPSSSSAGPYQVAASGTPAAVQAAIDASRTGEPADAGAERRARDLGWR
jgi:negative regulator of sigma E activity